MRILLDETIGPRRLADVGGVEVGACEEGVEFVLRLVHAGGASTYLEMRPFGA